MPLLTHTPVLIKETIDLLNLRTGTNVIDATLGLGGHSAEILKKIGPKGKLMAFEQDEENLKIAKKNLASYGDQVIYIHDNFENLKSWVDKKKFRPVQAILFDLGLSSPHVDDPTRGFSFKNEGPLDMRFDKRNPLTAAMLLARSSEKELADILWKYGEERASRKIARAIVEERRKKPFRTTRDLSSLLERLFLKKGRLHPATLTFQALRIAVNREAEVLEKALEQAIEVLEPKGRIAVISYHSLEDRIVKNKFRYYTQNCICPKELPLCQCDFQKRLYLLTKKPIIPSGIEVQKNPRSRSAKLRGAERL